MVGKGDQTFEAIKEVIPGVYLMEVDGRERLATLPPQPESIYGERILGSYRLWDPFRSKLAALLLKGREHASILKSLRLTFPARILYMGAAHGTTVSHLSDIVANRGLIYAVEISPRPVADLLMLCRRRGNIVPILGDASRPGTYSRLLEPVDMIYQDVAQREQGNIAAANAKRYLKPGGALVMMLKARSIDFMAPVGEVCRAEVSRLEGLPVEHFTDLMPFHQDHRAVVARKGF